jgi:hypothetical protein
MNRLGTEDIEAEVKQARIFWPPSMINHALDSMGKIVALRPDSDYSELLIERRVRIQAVPECYGTLDYAWVDLWNRLVVIDYKYGQGHAVDVISIAGELNPQLMIYATALAEEYDFAFETVQINIVQPRIREKVPQEIVITPRDLIDFRDNVLIPGIDATKQWNAATVPGGHCRWCPAKDVACFVWRDADSTAPAEESYFDFD